METPTCEPGEGHVKADLVLISKFVTEELLCRMKSVNRLVAVCSLLSVSLASCIMPREGVVKLKPKNSTYIIVDLRFIFVSNNFVQIKSMLKKVKAPFF